MLKRFRANNFRSLLNIEFRPAGLNLLVGPNNAGKTNLCSGLGFLAHSSEQSLDAALVTTVGERWNVTNLFTPEAKNLNFEVECDLPFQGAVLRCSYSLKLERARSSPRSDAVGSESLRIVEEVLRATGGRFADTTLLENKEGRVRMLHEEGYAKYHPNSPMYVESTTATNATMLSRLYELENNPRAILFRRYLQSWGYYSFNPDLLRSPDVDRGDGALLSTGANLCRAIFDLHTERPRLERKLIDAIRTLEPKLDLFSFSAPDVPVHAVPWR